MIPLATDFVGIWRNDWTYRAYIPELCQAMIAQTSFVAAVRSLIPTGASSALEVESGPSSKMSALPLAGPLTGAEIFATVQSGVTSQTLMTDIQSFIISSSGGPFLSLSGGNMIGAIRVSNSVTNGLLWPNGQRMVDADSKMYYSSGNKMTDSDGVIYYLNGDQLTDIQSRIVISQSIMDRLGSVGSTGQAYSVVSGAQKWGFAGQVGNRVALTGQTASIAATTIFTPTADGEFLVEVVLTTTTSGAAGTVLCTISWTDETGVTNATTATLVLTSTGHTQLIIPIHARTTGNIQYATTVAGLLAGTQYSLYVNVIRRS